jgi:hypothetical protein
VIVLEPLVSLGLDLSAGNIVSTTGEVFRRDWAVRDSVAATRYIGFAPQAPVGIARGSRPVLTQRPAGG